MAHKNIMLAAPVLALLMGGTAHAALSVDQVWADLQASAKTAGVDVKAATEARDGDALTLNGVTFDADGAKLTVSQLTLEPQSDGSVTMRPGDIAIEGGEGITAALTHDDLEISVHEDSAGYGYGVMADVLTVAFKSETKGSLFQDQLGGEGLDAAPETTPEGDAPLSVMDVNAKVDGFKARFTNDATNRAFEMTADALDYTVDQIDPAMEISGTQVSKSKDLFAKGSLAVPEGVVLAELEEPEAVIAALKSGLAFTAEMTTGDSEGTSKDNNPFFSTAISYKALPSQMSLQLDMNSLSMVTTGEGMEVTLLEPMVPAEATASIGAMEFGLSTPIVSPAEGGDYRLKLALADLELDDAAWSLIDPEGKADHSPADIDLDLDGKLKVDSIALMMGVGEDGNAAAAVPEVLSMNLNTLMVKLAGASLNGTGKFTFDNSMVEMGGPPMPIGVADLRLAGGTKVIDTLVAMGLLTEEDAGGARMMLMMFGKPVEGETDVLESKIEAKAGGEIHVNGQRIQ